MIHKNRCLIMEQADVTALRNRIDSLSQNEIALNTDDVFADFILEYFENSKMQQKEFFQIKKIKDISKTSSLTKSELETINGIFMDFRSFILECLILENPKDFLVKIFKKRFASTFALFALNCTACIILTTYRCFWPSVAAFSTSVVAAICSVYLYFQYQTASNTENVKVQIEERTTTSKERRKWN